MDAQKMGAFIAQCRKEKQMTQEQLAQRLQVTDKAVSRWERGVGFPDITTIEPLAQALGVEVLELMHAQRLKKPDNSNSETEQAVHDILQLAQEQRRQERKKPYSGIGDSVFPGSLVRSSFYTESAGISDIDCAGYSGGICRSMDLWNQEKKGSVSGCRICNGTQPVEVYPMRSYWCYTAHGYPAGQRDRGKSGCGLDRLCAHRCVILFSL